MGCLFCNKCGHTDIRDGMCGRCEAVIAYEEGSMVIIDNLSASPHLREWCEENGEMHKISSIDQENHTLEVSGFVYPISYSEVI